MVVKVENVFIRQAKEDKYVKNAIKLHTRTYKKCNTWLENIKEIFDRHTNSLPDRRNLIKQPLGTIQAKLVKAYDGTQALRSRAVGIKTETIAEQYVIDDHISRIKKRLKIEYSTELNKTKLTKDRDVLIDDVLYPLLKIQRKLKLVVQTIDLLLDDLDKNYWTIKGISEVVRLSFSREINI